MCAFSRRRTQLWPCCWTCRQLAGKRSGRLERKTPRAVKEKKLGVPLGAFGAICRDSGRQTKGNGDKGVSVKKAQENSGEATICQGNQAEREGFEPATNSPETPQILPKAAQNPAH